jgi:hypothetical protein
MLARPDISPVGPTSMKNIAASTPSPSRLAVQLRLLACAVFGGRFAAGSGLLSSPIAPAIGYVGCTRSGSQTASPKSRAPVKYPG